MVTERNLVERFRLLTFKLIIKKKKNHPVRTTTPMKKCLDQPMDSEKEK